MVFGIVLALLAGIFAGTFTGLFPGIHINLVAAFLLAGAGYFSGVDALVLAVFVVAMAVTHTFIDFIPSVFLGAPDEDSFLAVLPGHQLLKEGKGYEAVVLTLYGGMIALPIVLVFSFVFIYFLEDFFGFVQGFIPYVLIFASFYLIFREEEFLISLSVFLFSGLLGLFAFNLPVEDPLLPLLSGLFGVSGLIVSLKDTPKLPKQEIANLREIKMSRRGFLKSSFAAALVAPFSSFLPGMGSGQAAIVASEIMGEDANDKRNFLFLVGAINTIVMALSFVTFYVIQKARTGAAVAVGEILGAFGFRELALILAVIFLSGIFSFFVGVFTARILALHISKVPYQIISLIVIFILVNVNLVLSNPLGLIVLITSSALGVFAILSGARRINLMGVLLVPTIVFYLAG